MTYRLLSEAMNQVSPEIKFVGIAAELEKTEDTELDIKELLEAAEQASEENATKEINEVS